MMVLCSVLQLVAHTQAASRTFAYCAFGAQHQKYTTVMHDEGWTELEALDSRQCTHGNEAHAEQLRGRHATGESRAGRAAAYPDELNEFVAAAAVAALRRRAAAAAEAAPVRRETSGKAAGARGTGDWRYWRDAGRTGGRGLEPLARGGARVRDGATLDAKVRVGAQQAADGR